MTISIAVIIKILWLFSALFDYGEYCYRWQLKEYRWDRFKDFLDSKKGERFLFSYSVFWRGMIALLAFLFPFNSTVYLQYALILILGIDFSLNLAKLINRKVKRPVPTKKAISVILLTLVIEASVFLILGSWRLILVF